MRGALIITDNIPIIQAVQTDCKLTIHVPKSSISNYVPKIMTVVRNWLEWPVTA